MKFGKKLLEHADPSHLNHCIAYDVLTKAINVVVAAYHPQAQNEPDIREDMEAVDQAFGQSTQTLSGPGVQPPDSRFHTLLQHELAKVNRFAALQLRTLLDTLSEAQRELANMRPDSSAAAADRLLDAAGAQLVALERFRRLNFTGFRKITKKFDKKTREVDAQRGSLASWFIPQLMRERFVATPLDTHLLALAWGYAVLRHRRRVRSETEASVGEAAPYTPTTSATYWLTPSARMQALCMLVKRFDIVLGPEAADELGDAGALVEQLQRLLASMSPDGVARVPQRQLSTDVSLLYLDSPGFPEYLDRLRKSESESDGLAGFHVRRGLPEAGPTGATVSGLVERDGAASALGRHAFAGSEALEAPDAFPVGAPASGNGSSSKALQDAAEAVLSAQAALPAGNQDKLLGFAREVAATAGKAPLSPVAAVGISRVLLHGDTSSTRGVCIAVDENVQFSKGPTEPAATAPSDTIDFPYCLLEVAGTSPESTSTWLAELRGHAILRKVAGFSIGAHAVAALHREELPELPHWYQHLSLAESSSPPEAWGLMLEWRAAVHETEKGQEAGVPPIKVKVPAAASEGKAKAAGQAVAVAVPEAFSGGGGKPKASVAEDKELRPKDFLASERTMLEWMHTVVALAFLGFGLWRYSLRGSTAESRADTLGLLNTSGASLALGCYSLVLIAMAISFAWYSVVCHLKRTQALVNGNPAERLFNVRRGPVLFGALLGVSLLANLLQQGADTWRKLGTAKASI
mmetsp:Transcript_53177/g.158442  ORF Transcript_53177/g.158442 Transcript_53177/m.158442 type:complete len:749 (+) Transcript_53177:86-2332(+)